MLFWQEIYSWTKNQADSTFFFELVSLLSENCSTTMAWTVFVATSWETDQDPAGTSPCVVCSTLSTCNTPPPDFSPCLLSAGSTGLDTPYTQHRARHSPADFPLLVSKQFENSMEGRINPWSFRSGWGHPESLLEALPYLATIIPVCALTGGQGRPVIQGIETVLHDIQEQGLAGRLKTFPNQTIVTTCHTGTRGGENCFKHFLQ